ncbi:MAG TPA: hypothetical protein VJY63_00350 [Marinospirillum sp.]|uniref:hypothetical protein n=1 Tax=Marinospirillum sp. TaxID=2183934 RepID=UPI002B4987F2|nr:hypothetical protein [Marinospirillum sp.]HKM14361.1 hypothetical protein [Marinospirillum sp.]
MLLPSVETSSSTPLSRQKENVTNDGVSTAKQTTTENQIKPELQPDEIRFGRKRPLLPITFSFGIRRSKAVAVAMRYPLLGGKQPTTFYQAILDTFDLAATNRLPYFKGTEVNVAA